MTDTTAAAPNGLATTATMSSGSFTAAGNATSIQLGFNPRYFRLFDEAGGFVWEKCQGDLPANSWKSNTLDTASTIGFPADTGLNEPGSSVLLSAALCVAGKVLSWVAFS